MDGLYRTLTMDDTFCCIVVEGLQFYRYLLAWGANDYSKVYLARVLPKPTDNKNHSLYNPEFQIQKEDHL